MDEDANKSINVTDKKAVPVIVVFAIILITVTISAFLIGQYVEKNKHIQNLEQLTTEDLIEAGLDPDYEMEQIEYPAIPAEDVDFIYAYNECISELLQLYEELNNEDLKVAIIDRLSNLMEMDKSSDMEIVVKSMKEYYDYLPNYMDIMNSGVEDSDLSDAQIMIVGKYTQKSWVFSTKVNEYNTKYGLQYGTELYLYF